MVISSNFTLYPLIKCVGPLIFTESYSNMHNNEFLNLQRNMSFQRYFHQFYVFQRICIPNYTKFINTPGMHSQPYQTKFHLTYFMVKTTKSTENSYLNKNDMSKMSLVVQ